MNFSFSLEDFFQGMMRDDLLFQRWTAEKSATRRSNPTIDPVTISRARSHLGFDALWCLATIWADWCLGAALGLSWVLTSCALPATGITFRKPKLIEHVCRWSEKFLSYTPHWEEGLCLRSLFCMQFPWKLVLVTIKKETLRLNWRLREFS